MFLSDPLALLHGPPARPARGAHRDRRPRHVRGGRPGAARDAVRGQPADPGARVEPRPGRRPAHDALPADRGGSTLLRAGPPDPAAVRRGARRARAPTGRSAPTSRSPSTPTPSPPGSATSWAGSPSGTTSTLRLHVEDQAFSADLLRSGEALAAVTSDDVAGAGLLDRAPRRAPLPARGGARVRRAVAARPGPGLGADAGRRVQREGRPPARPAPRPRASTQPAVATGSRPRPTSTRRSGSASAGRRSPSRSWTPTSSRDAWCCSARASTSTYTSTGSGGAWTRPCWPASPTRYAAPPHATCARNHADPSETF